MQLQDLVRQRVVIEAYYAELLPTRWNFKYKVLLRDVFINGHYFRDHTFIKYSKRWCNIPVGSVIRFIAIVTEYTHKGKKKYGLRKARFVHQATNKYTPRELAILSPAHPCGKVSC